MKIDEVPLSRIKEVRDKWAKIGKHYELYQRMDDLDTTTGLEIRCENLEEYKSIEGSVRSRIKTRNLPFRLSRLKSKLTILIERIK